MKTLIVLFASLFLFATQAFGASVVIYWNPSTDNPGGSGVAGYKVYRNGTLLGSASITTFTDTNPGASPATNSYTVSAYDNAGNESAQSSAATVTTGTTHTLACSGNITSALNTLIASSADGDIISVSSGSCSMSGGTANFDNTKGLTIKCATANTCNIAATGTVMGMNPALSGVNSHFYRISGFNFTQASAGAFTIWFWGAGTLQQVRIDHNNFTDNNGGNTIVFFGEDTTVAQFFGVMDHNTFTSTSSIAAFQYQGASATSPIPSAAGTVSNMFFEDNTITITTMTDDGTGCMDGWAGNDVVYRHNTSTNCLVTTHGLTHSGGPENIELYNNSIIVNSGVTGFPNWEDCSRCFHHQGSGEFYAFNNSFTPFSGHSTSPISMLHYCAYASCIDGVDGPICDGNNTSARPDGGKDGNRTPQATYQGYPCWHQPGRDFAATPLGGNLKPHYSWNNTFSDNGAKAPYQFEDLGGSPDYTPQHAKTDRDYFDAVSVNAQTSSTSPFNGTTGMGFGTLANRPATCSTASTDAADAGKGGVGYFATDVGPQGTLYACHSTNTWVVQYTPYTYPHPLTTQP